jgi:nicotinate phosphoribosyltransferase
MGHLEHLYGRGLALLTDLYQLTMVHGYLDAGLADHEAVFHLHFRKNPFAGGYAIACGLHTAIEVIEGFGFDQTDLDYLAALTGNDDQPLFGRAFLDWLGGLALCCDVDALPEGTPVFPMEPLVRVRGPLIQCQLLETVLLNCVNFETLIATKAARICQAARGEPVLEFGLRRAQGTDGAVTASRAAYLGGCAATSNLLAGKLFDIPVRGTHAHSWVMSFDEELAAFEAYAAAMPNNCVFLVDTYDTLTGVEHAIDAGRRLRARGHEMIGIRLDSGDLNYLSVEARRMLDEAGFADAVIVASNDLDEHVIQSLQEQGAAIGVWGVGTKLATAYDQPALGGVYKLSAIRAPGGAWRHKVKLSEQKIKISNPGVLQVRRFFDADGPVADCIWDELTGIGAECQLVDPMDPARRKCVSGGCRHEDLLVPIFRGGARCYQAPTLHQARDRARAQLAAFDAGVKRFLHPHQYPVGLELGLHKIKTDLIFAARGIAE